MTSVLEITEELWQRIAPLLPPAPPANGRSVLLSEVESQLLDPPGGLSARLGHPF
jgi:transposase